MHMKTALLTGATGKLGSAIAIFLAQNGWNIALHYTQAEEKAVALSREIEQYKVNAQLIKADFSILDEVHSIFQKIETTIHLLINNASTFINDNAKNFSLNNLRLHMDVNILAPALLSQYFASQLPDKEDGNIINMLDYSIFKTPHNFFSYHNSKAALAYLTKISARQYAPRVKVNGIALGHVKNLYSCDTKFVEASPLQIATPMEDITAAINFILKTQSMTGQIITLDSGMHLADHIY